MSAVHYESVVRYKCYPSSICYHHITFSTCGVYGQSLMIIKARNLRIAALAASLTLLLTAFGMSEAVRAADSSSPTLKLPVPRINTANRKKFRSHIQRAAQRHRLDPLLLHAVITVESAYNPRAVSSAGAMGLMQLMPGTAERFGVADPFDPAANINAGARYLRILLDRFGTIQLALASYHAGEGRVQRGRRTIPRIPATNRYVIDVIHAFMYYKKNGV